MDITKINNSTVLLSEYDINNETPMVVDYHGWGGDSNSQENDSQEWLFKLFKFRFGVTNLIDKHLKSKIPVLTRLIFNLK